MQARDVMTTAVVSVGPETEVKEIAKLLAANRISGVPVVNREGKLVGIVSEGDLMRRPETGTIHRSPWWLWILPLPEEQARKYVKTHGHHASEVMTRRVITVDEEASLESIADILEKHRIKRVPVMRDGTLVGIVSRADLLHGLSAWKVGSDPSINDRAIKQAIEDELNEAGVMTRRVKIVVCGGIVHLWGTVITPAEREAVHVAAESVAGVKALRDNVVALPPDERSYYWAV